MGMAEGMAAFEDVGIISAAPPGSRKRLSGFGVGFFNFRAYPE